MVKRYIALLCVISIFGNSAGYAAGDKREFPETDLILSRFTSIPVFNRPKEKFNSYFINPLDAASGFRLFEEDRISGIQLIKKYLGDLRIGRIIQGFIRNSINKEDNDTFQKIFKTTKYSMDKGVLSAFLDDKGIQEQYLDYYLNDNVPLKIIINCHKNGKTTGDERETYGIIDALAYIKKTSFYAYAWENEQPGSTLYLIHRFYIPNEGEKKISTVLENQNFKRLIPTNNNEANKRALDQETRDLQILSEHIRQNERKPSSTLASPSNNDPAFDDKARTPAREDNSAADEDNSDADDVRKGTPSPAHSEENTDTEELTDILNFLNHKAGELPGHNYQDSLNRAFNFLHNRTMLENQPVDMQMCYFFGIVRLLVDFDYSPPSPFLERTSYMKKMDKDLKDFINDYRTDKDRKLKKLVNYARILRGKVLVKLNRLDEAYKSFGEVEKGYTKTYLVDMAEMIINGYRPAELSNEDPMEFALSLLSQTRQSSTSMGSGRASKRVIQNDLNTLAQPGFLTRTSTKRRVAELLGRATTEDTIPHTELPQQSHTLHTHVGATQESREGVRGYHRTSLINQIDSTKSNRRDTFLPFSRREEGFGQNQISPSDNLQRPAVMEELNLSPINEEEGEEEQNEENAASYSFDDFDGGDAPPLSPMEIDNKDQSEKADRFLAKLFNEKYEECRRLIAYGKTHRNEKAAAYFQQALELAQKINNLPLQVEALIGLGNSKVLNRGENYQNALEIAETIGDKKLQARALIGLGYTNSNNNNNLKNAIEHFEKALVLANEIEDKNLRIQVLLGLGNVKGINNVEHLINALKLTEEVGDQLGMVRSLLSLANAKDRNRIPYIIRAYEIAKIIGNKEYMARILIARGDAKDGDRQHHYQEALKLAKELDNQGLEAKALLGLANLRDNNQINYYYRVVNIARTLNKKIIEFQGLIGLGNTLSGIQQVECYQLAAKIAKEIGSREYYCQALIGLGNTRYGNQIEYYGEALKIALDIQDPELEARARIGLGNAGDSNRIQHYRLALQIARNGGHKELEAKALLGLANAGDANRVDHYLAVLRVSEEIGISELKAEACIGLGNTQYPYENNHNSRDWYYHALETLGKEGDSRLQARAFIGLGHSGKSKYYYNALQVLGENGDSYLKALTLISLGHARDGDTKQHYLLALQIARNGEHKELEAKALIGLGKTKDVNSLQHFHMALKIAEEINNETLKAEALIGLGNAGDKDKIQNLHSALEMTRKIGDKALEVQTLISLGNSRQENQIEYYLLALELARKIKHEKLEAKALICLGKARDNNCIQHFRAALKIAVKIGDRFFQAQALIGLGNASDGDRIQHYQSALKIAEEIGDKALQAQALIGLGNASREKNRIQYYLSATKNAQEIGHKSLQAQALIGLGNARYTDEKHPRDCLWYEEALHILGENGDSSLRIKAIRGLINYYNNSRNYNSKMVTYYTNKINDLQPGNSSSLGTQRAPSSSGQRKRNRDGSTHTSTHYNHRVATSTPAPLGPDDRDLWQSKRSRTDASEKNRRERRS